MAKKQKHQQKDVIAKLAETGEEALQRLAELLGSARVVEAATSLRDRVDELTKRMRSLDPLEKRVAELERRLEDLTKTTPKPAPAKRTTTAARKPAAKKPAAKKPASR